MKEESDALFEKKVIDSIAIRDPLFKSGLISNKTFGSELKYRGTFFTNPKFDGCTFNGSTFNGGDCERILFKRCVFNECMFNGGDFIKSEFIDCTFKNCSISRGNYHKASFKKSRFYKTEIKMVNIRKTNFTDTILEQCTIAGNAGWANFQNSVMKEVDFSNCTLRHAIVNNIQASDCIFKVTDLPFLITPSKEHFKSNYLFWDGETRQFDPSEILEALLTEFLSNNDYSTSSNICLILGDVKEAFNLMFRGLDYYFNNNNYEELYRAIKLYSISFQKYFPELRVESLLQLILLRKNLSDANHYFANEKYFLDALEYLQNFNFEIELNKCSLDYHKGVNDNHIRISFDESFSYSELLFLLSPFLETRANNQMNSAERQFDTIMYRGSEGIELTKILVPMMPGIITLLVHLYDRWKKKDNDNNQEQMVNIKDERQLVLIDNRVQVFSKINDILVFESDSESPYSIFPPNM